MGLKIVVAPDKFKGTLSASAAATAIAAGLRTVFPDAILQLVGVADGGDGTMQAILDALGGRVEEREVAGPDERRVRAKFALVGDGKTAVVELAQASGLAIVEAGRNDPLTATTFGTGELIGAALKCGASRIVLAIGGSATNDAGVGALAALGARFYDQGGRALPRGGAALSMLARIETGDLERRLAGATIDIASDVTNPLCGPDGASAVYGPQKGASPDDVARLDAALAHFADVAAATTGADMRGVPGAGAAGGAGGGFLALAGARLHPGAELVLELLRFDEKLVGAALVITGEGRLDRQTLSGKAPYAVARAARSHGIPVIAIAGAVECSADDLERMGVASAFPTVDSPMSLPDALTRSEPMLRSAAERVARALALGMQLKNVL